MGRLSKYSLVILVCFACFVGRDAPTTMVCEAMIGMDFSASQQFLKEHLTTGMKSGEVSAKILCIPKEALPKFVEVE